MDKKDFQFDLKSVGEDGTFEGWLSVYDVVDLGNDMLKPGAFTKTIQENGGRVPMLWQHNTHEPIGTLELTDKAEGLWVKGALLLEVQRAREAYALVKAGVIKGLSIGFQAIPDKVKKVLGVRQISEVKLFEGSVVTFPMLPVAQIASVKAASVKDFLSELSDAETWARRFMMQDALMSALDQAVWGNLPAAEKVTASAESIDQFREQYLQFLPQLLTLRGDKADDPAGRKAGRRISAATRTQINEAIEKLTALRDGADGTSEEAADDTAPEAVAKRIEPEAFHSLLNGFRDDVVSAIRA